MQSSGGPGSAPPFTFPDLGPVIQRGPTGQVIDPSAPASEASAVPTPASASASGAPRRPQASAAVPVASAPSSGAGGSAGAAPSSTPASAGARGVAGGLQAAPSVVAHHASAASTGETSASSAVAPTLPTPALPSASGASSDPACTQLVPRSSPDSSPLHEPSSSAAHFCHTGDPLPATACEASGLPPRSSAQWYAVEDIVHHEVQAAVEELREHTERRFADFAQLMVGLCERYEASLKASDSLLAKDRELFKSGLQEYNRNMRQLRSLLVNQARGQPKARELVRRMDDNVLPRAFDAFLEVFDSAYSASGAAPATPSSRESSSRAGTTRHRAAALADVQADVSMEPAESGNDSDDESTSPRPAKRRCIQPSYKTRSFFCQPAAESSCQVGFSSFVTHDPSRVCGSTGSPCGVTFFGGWFGCFQHNSSGFDYVCSPLHVRC
ncbi:hypothetical protein PHYSODRAFT_262664 [Phytophthora sojae]|uniref:Uncharacterized protein n=1 Tax=Phytophthora sojae (strain P6497) TaxID=1094619 RepID=G5AB94_PHYSP|nr:hypothetical protein PHYSODRAFT_262664 [Phytophthora sojae]EGZ07239.1 hypothetical protein PHYSODRAFT_262664 [Phytophthora sojae]|eukprot:XP_009536805.1 hypothetical protein PHYSODRAFT_262664 [Phytophthora sojae]